MLSSTSGGRSLLRSAFKRFLPAQCVEVAKPLLFSTAVEQTTKGEETLGKLRSAMSEAGVDALIVPTDDPHLSEYAPDHYNRREFVSGFTGSAGTAVIMKDQALLWTDGRYFLQAEQQLGDGWKLMKTGLKDTPSIAEYLKNSLAEHASGAVVGLDPFVHSAQWAASLRQTLKSAGISTKSLEENLVDKVWGQYRPPYPQHPIRVHPLKFAGRSVPQKLEKIRAKLKKEGADALVVTALDEVAYLYNIRGRDIDHCPVALSYAIVTQDKAILFLDSCKVPEEVLSHLGKSGVVLKDYSKLLGFLSDLTSNNKKVWVDEGNTNDAVFSAIPEHLIIKKTSPLQTPKAVKNDAEIAGMKEAHIRDGAAMANFLQWMQEEVVENGRAVSEVEIDVKLNGFRADQDMFLEPSFPTIAGSGPNGAIIHYRAEEESCGYVDHTSMLLLDSGAQYVDGTTDVTRTMHFGEPTQWQRECYTRVLKGNIAVDSAVFPENAPGLLLDSFARRALWEAGLDYAHGTGHGVGAALNVHEGPQSISPRTANTTPLQPGMVVSNEPGYYEPGNFGVRIENLLLVCEAGTASEHTGRKFRKFERLTLIPIQKSLIDVSLMTVQELDWLDAYHEEVWDKISPLVEGKTLSWLTEATAPIHRK